MNFSGKKRITFPSEQVKVEGFHYRDPTLPSGVTVETSSPRESEHIGSKPLGGRVTGNRDNESFQGDSYGVEVPMTTLGNLSPS